MLMIQFFVQAGLSDAFRSPSHYANSRPVRTSCNSQCEAARTSSVY